MDKSGESSPATPAINSCKRLGLQRSRLKRSYSQSPISTVLCTSQKVNCQRAAASELVSSATPSPSTTPLRTSTLQRASASTGQYKLSLSRRVRDKFKKKRLNFAHSSHKVEATSEKENVLDISLKQDEVAATTRKRVLVPKDSNLESSCCERKTTGSTKFEWQEHRMQELNEAIATWKRVFNQAVRDLSSKLNVGAEDLLPKLQLPVDMLHYLEGN